MRASWQRARVWCVVACMMAALAGAPPSGATGPGQAPPERLPGEVLVKFKPGTPGQAVAEAHRQHGAQVQETIAGIDVHVLRVPSGREDQIAAALSRNPNVEFAEVNGLYRAIGTPGYAADGTPNDTLVGQQWQYHNTGLNGGTVGADIKAFQAWTVQIGSDTVVIAVLDTGIAQSHPDLPQGTKVTRNVNYTGSADPNNRSLGTNDLYGHGTHVAGSAAAVTDNGTGVAGTCPRCVLWNVKVLGDDGSGAWSWIANGIRSAADDTDLAGRRARVVSMSLGGLVGSSTVRSAVDYAWSKGLIVVAAAGNNGSSTPFYPAAYKNAIAVAATTNADAKASFSNFGKNWVDVAAPGQSILSTAPTSATVIWPNGTSGYATISGTSMATPHVAGVAGLVWSTGLCSSNTCVRNRIEGRADPIAGTGTYWSKGRINAAASVQP